MVALRGWQHAGLVSVGLCATLGLSLCFFGVAGPFQPGLGLLATVLGVLEAGSSMPTSAAATQFGVARFLALGWQTSG